MLCRQGFCWDFLLFCALPRQQRPLGTGSWSPRLISRAQTQCFTGQFWRQACWFKLSSPSLPRLDWSWRNKWPPSSVCLSLSLSCFFLEVSLHLPFPSFSSFPSLTFFFHPSFSISFSVSKLGFPLHESLNPRCLFLSFFSSFCHVKVCRLLTAQGQLARKRNEGGNASYTLLTEAEALVWGFVSPKEASCSNLQKSILGGLGAALSSLGIFPGESSHFVFFFWPRLPLNLNRNLHCAPSPTCWPNLGRLELHLYHKHTIHKCSCAVLVLSSFFLVILYFHCDASWRANLSVIGFNSHFLFLAVGTAKPFYTPVGSLAVVVFL